MKNYWLDRATTLVEREVILVKQSPETKMWYDRMSSVLPCIYPDHRPQKPEDFQPKVGLAHHLRLSKFGIEAVIKAPRKYQRMSFYVLHDKINTPHEPFWVIFYVP